MVYTVLTRFEWDARKARSNIVKHGVSFELAMTAFDDPFGLVAVDDSHSTPDETREWISGPDLPPYQRASGQPTRAATL